VIINIWISCKQSKTDINSKSNSYPKVSTSSIESDSKIKSSDRNSIDNLKIKSNQVAELELPFSIDKIDSLPNSFFGSKWLRSPSEDEIYGGDVYRPDGHEALLPMRFTPYFVFEKDNVCQILVLMSNDAHVIKNASWAYLTKNELQVFVTGDNGKEVLRNWKVKYIGLDLVVFKTSGFQK